MGITREPHVMADHVFDPTAGIERSLVHLAPCVVPYTLRLKSGDVVLPIAVYYANHCYTRSRKPGDSPEAVLFREPKHGGAIDERVFCIDRWSFSQRLPAVLEKLEGTMCYRSSQNELFYRVEDAKPSGGGWAICMRLDINASAQELRLSVRSVHHRQNLPHDVKHPQVRFFSILRDFYLPRVSQYPWLPK